MTCGRERRAPAIRGSENLGTGGRFAGSDAEAPTANPCPPATLMLNLTHYDDGICWQYAGIQNPYYGAFADWYEHDGCVCGIELHLATIGDPCIPCTGYVWDDAGFLNRSRSAGPWKHE